MVNGIPIYSLGRPYSFVNVDNVLYDTCNRFQAQHDLCAHVPAIPSLLLLLSFQLCSDSLFLPLRINAQCTQEETQYVTSDDFVLDPSFPNVQVCCSSIPGALLSRISSMKKAVSL